MISAVWPQEAFLRFMSNQIACLENQPVRDHMSLEEAAVAVWIRPIENLDYYCGGAVIGFLLDLTIRANRRNLRSLDDVMRALFAATKHPRYGGYSEGGLMRALSAAAGDDMEPFLTTWARTAGTQEYAAVLSRVGLDLSVTAGEDGKRSFSLRRADAQPQAASTVLDGITAEAPRE